MIKLNSLYKIFKKAAWTVSDIYKIEPKTYESASEICKKFKDKGIYTTIGRFSREGENPERIVCEYLAISNILKKDNEIKNNFYLSMKPPALNFDLQLIKKIANVEKEKGQSIHFDSHGYKVAMPTFYIVEEIKKRIFKENNSEDTCWCGVTLPTRWKRSLKDSEWAIKNNLRVRLVKGEFPADNKNLEIDPKMGFLKIVEKLSGKIGQLALATHDYELAKNAVEIARKRKQKIELELLYGMPVGRMISLSKEMNIPIRFYIPYGDTLLVYGVLHLMKYPRKLFRPNSAAIIASNKRKTDYILKSL